MGSQDNQELCRALEALATEDYSEYGDTDKAQEDRDGDRDYRRRNERDQDSRRRDGRGVRDRRRGRDEEDSKSSKLVRSPIVLLKRPEAWSPSTSNGQGGSEGGEEQGKETGGRDDKQEPKTSTIQRSPKTTHEQVDQSITEKGKSMGPRPLTGMLKPVYKFPTGKSLPLIDSKMKMCSWGRFDYDSNNYSNNKDYLVVTVIGKRNVGKSTLLSYLAGDEQFGTRNIFGERRREEEMQSSIYISSDQIVFIELSSLFNQAAAFDLITVVSRQRGGVLENVNETWNLRLVRWALSVSHVIIVISDNVLEPTIFQLMNSAEKIRAMDSALGEGSYPEPIYVCNKADLEVIDKIEASGEFQKYFTSVFGRAPRIETNYFVLPHMKYEFEHGRFSNFKSAILNFNRYNRAPFAPDKDGLGKLVQQHVNTTSKTGLEMQLAFGMR